MTQFFSFFVILLVSVLFSAIFKRFHLPWLVSLIIGGMIVGPHGFDLFEINETTTFLSEIGIIFMMFMAGLETKLSILNKMRKKVMKLAVLNGLIPFVVGIAVGLAFDMSWLGALLIGTIFISTSAAVVVPMLESTGIIGNRLGKTIVSAAVVEDIASLLILSILLQRVAPVTSVPLPLFYVFLIGSVVFLRFGIPRLKIAFEKYAPHLFEEKGAKALYQQELRVMFTLLIGTVLLFELLGLHPIVAGFFTGLVVSELITSHILLEKVQAISYGLFIPFFFVTVGAETNFWLFLQHPETLWLSLALTGALISSKFVSGWIGGRLDGFSNMQSYFIGIASMPTLSTGLAVAVTALELGLIDEGVLTAMILLSVITTFAGSTLAGRMSTHPAIQK